MNEIECPVQLAIGLISGKWKSLILYQLLDKTLRYNQLKKCLPDVSERMLAKQLKSLEEDGLLARTVYPEVPPKVEYQLTELGKGLVLRLKDMAEWGEQYSAQRNSLKS